jgi:hypothetical protein
MAWSPVRWPKETPPAHPASLAPVTEAEVIAYIPSLADKLALSTSDSAVEDSAAEITNMIRDG